MSAFEELGVMPEIIQAIEEIDWLLPTPIQQDAIPMILGGGDVLAAAETGSGKTGAFAIPMIQVTHETLRGATGVTVAPKSDRIQMNLEDRENAFAIDSAGTTCQSRVEGWAGGRASIGVTKGKYCFEATVTDEGLCRVGWSNKTARLDLGTDKNGFGYGGTGKKSNNKQFDAYGEEFKLHDTVSCYIDLEKYVIGFAKNGKDFGPAFQIPNNLRNSAFYPAAVLKNAELKFNFGATPLKFPIAGFQPIDAATPEHTSLLVSEPTKKGRKPIALILEPSRELAEQTYNAIISFSKHIPAPKLEHGLFIGGSASAPQLQDLQRGLDIVTGTPGRLIDLVENGNLDLSEIRFFVLDEADSLAANNLDIINKLFARLPQSKLQVLMFSATLHSQEIRKLADKITKFPTWVDLKGKDAVPEGVHHGFVWADPAEDQSWHAPSHRITTDKIHKNDAVRPGNNNAETLSEGIKLLKPLLLLKIIDAYKMDQAMIFARTKIDCDNLEAFFNAISGNRKGAVESEYSCVVLHGDRSVNERKDNLRKFKDGECRFLICTDVAARGIDIKELPYMINYCLPDKAEDYIHRTGRVGRADRVGLAVSIVGKAREKVWYHQCASRGAKCSNTELLDKGGCAIWYDEPTYLADIEARLNQTVPHLNKEFKLELNDFQKGAVYGQARNKESAPVYQVHVEQIRDKVTELAALEDRMQGSFWALKTKYSKPSTSAANEPHRNKRAKGSHGDKKL